MKALVREIIADSKGRALLLVVADCMATDLRQQLQAGPVELALMTHEQLAAQRSAAAQAASGDGMTGGALAKWLAQSERDQAFWRFMREVHGRNVSSPETAEAAVKALVQFGSRKQLDNDPEVCKRFKHEILYKYQGWQGRRS
jgi:hypothetical protein